MVKSHIVETVKSLKKQLDHDGGILIQQSGGALLKTCCKFNPPATPRMLKNFSSNTNWHIPTDLIELFEIHCGCVLFNMNSECG